MQYGDVAIDAGMLSVVLACRSECWDIVRSAEMLLVILGMWVRKNSAGLISKS